MGGKVTVKKYILAETGAEAKEVAKAEAAKAEAAEARSDGRWEEMKTG